MSISVMCFCLSSAVNIKLATIETANIYFNTDDKRASAYRSQFAVAQPNKYV